MNAIFTRTSVRQFEEKEVEQEKIEKILQAAFASPTAKNQQAWEFYVVTNKEILQKLSTASPFATPAANAPAAIVICYRKENLRVPEKVEIDCAIATENIWLECEELGLGGVMLGIAPEEDRMKAVEEILNIPENLRAFTIFPFGYPKNKKPQKNRYDENKIHFVK
ncbi:MAG: nitroreductase family protein [Selenomonadaceae bacterium]|nr:nitroreductase family protein [Selenomonadaceae bacterium]